MSLVDPARRRSGSSDSMRCARRALLALLLAVPMLGSSPARAQEAQADRTEEARRLFDEGLAFGREGRWDEAAARYRRVLQLRDSAQVRFNLAQALAEGGRVVESTTLLGQIGRNVQAPEAVREAARALRAEVEPRVARLTLRLEGAAAGVVVTMDGELVDPAAIGAASRVDPGHHQIEVARGDEVVASAEATLEDGSERELVIQVPAPPSPPSVGLGGRDAAHLATAPAEEEGGGVLSSPWLWIGAAVLVAGGIVAAVLLSGSGAEDPLSGNLMPGRLEFP